MLIFSANDVIDRMLSLYGVRTNKELSQIFDASPGLIANWKVRNNVPLDFLIKVKNEKNVSLDWLVFGQEMEKGRILSDLENLALQAFNALSDREKILAISAMSTGASAGGSVTQNGGSNNYYSGENFTINEK